MPDFKLSDDEIYKLQRQFYQFQAERKLVHELLDNYTADYRQFSGKASERYEYLRKKYISKAPDLSHLIFKDEKILWSVDDIAIILGRHISSIIRTFNKLEKSKYYSKLVALRQTEKAENGHDIFVYEREIFDLIIDFYEDEYLLRFAKPRRGNLENAPDINEVKKFWNYLKERENFNSYNIKQSEHNTHMPDIPPMSFKDIIALIWKKVFSVKIGTVCSVIFAVCFEITRRFFKSGVSVWLAVIPAVIYILCIFLIHGKKFKPDILSDVGAGALLFTFLWISGALSLSDLKNLSQTPEIKQELKLLPQLINQNIQFVISANNMKNVKEFLYRISPDVEFHSTGLNVYTQYPEQRINYDKINAARLAKTADIDVKYINNNDEESEVWHFSFDVQREFFKLKKHNTLTFIKEPWVEARRVSDKDWLMTYVTLSSYSRGILEAIVYGINTLSPDIKINPDSVGYDNEILNCPAGQVDFVSSYLIFTDGTSSDIRVSRIEK